MTVDESQGSTLGIEPLALERRRPFDGPVLLPRGASVGRFVILDRLGGGATGTVYSAFDPTLDRQVALKILHSYDDATDDGDSATTQRGRVERESRAMARIKHPNVVTIYEVGVADNGSVFLAMEKIDGGTLGAWLATKRSMREILRVFGEAGEGLAAAHRSGLVHRDFKLDNVLMDTDEHPRVTDFGLARALGPSGEHVEADAASATSAPSSHSALSEPLTRSGAVLGTPGYMPPEQYGTAAIDARADVFAFCAALYRGLYGERPFVGDTIEEITFSTLHGRLRDPPKDTDVPVWIRRVLLRGLATKREARPSSMDELLAMLRDDPARRWRRGGAVALGGLALLGAAWGAHAASARRAHACDAAEQPLQNVWNDARAAQVAATFRAAGPAYADDAFAQVARVLDGYAGRWRAESEAACTATRIRGEQSEQMLELRTACLDDRLAEIRALVDVLSAADAEVVKSSPKAARALSPLESCADVDRLSAASRPPTDTATRQEIRALQDDVSRAKELHEAGRKRQALELLESIRPGVEKLDWRPLLERWTFRMAAVEKRADEKSSVADFERAIALAEQSRTDEMKAAAEIALGSFEGSWLGRTEDAHMWMRMADATIARLGGNARLEIARDEEEGWVYQYEHKLSQAAPLFRRVLARAGEAGIDEPDTIASAHSGLADALVAEGKWDEAEEHALVALKTMEDGYGRDHPWISGFVNNLAMAQLETGDTAGALASATRARDMLENEVKRGDIDGKAPDYGLALHTLGEVQIRTGAYEAAVASLTQARTIYRAAHGNDNGDVAYADNELAAAYRGVGRTADARAALEDAVRIEAVVADVPGSVRAGTLAMEARLALERGDPRAAADLAEKSIALAHDGEVAAWTLAETRLVLAETMRARGLDPKRAGELATEALDVFERLHDDAHQKEAARAAELARTGD